MNKFPRSVKNIDRRFTVLDRKCFYLIVERFEHAIELGRIKQRLRENLRNSRREAEVLRHVASVPCRFLSKQVRRSMYRTVMAAARKLEAQTKNEHTLFPIRQTRLVLRRAKKKLRKSVDKLDTDIVRVLDTRMNLAARFGFLDGSIAIQNVHAEKLRKRICALNANSDIQQWIWQIISYALGRQTSFVATPIKAYQLLGRRKKG